MHDEFNIVKIRGNFLVSMFLLVSKFIVNSIIPILIPLYVLRIWHHIETIVTVNENVAKQKVNMLDNGCACALLNT